MLNEYFSLLDARPYTLNVDLCYSDNMNINTILTSQPFFWILFIWAFVWKGIALWKAVTKRQLVWFVLLLILNTSGILEIVYIFWLSRFPIDKNQTLLKFLNEKVGQKIKSA